jgi:hypothetical protein
MVLALVLVHLTYLGWGSLPMCSICARIWPGTPKESCLVGNTVVATVDEQQTKTYNLHVRDTYKSTYLCVHTTITGTGTCTSTGTGTNTGTGTTTTNPSPRSLRPAITNTFTRTGTSSGTTTGTGTPTSNNTSPRLLNPICAKRRHFGKRG